MIEQSIGPGGATIEPEQVRASNSTPRAAHDFAAIFAQTIGDRAPTPRGLAQTVRNELKDPNQVNLASIAAGELTQPAESTAAQPAPRIQVSQSQADAPPPPRPPSAEGQGAAREQSVEASARPAGRAAPVEAKSAQATPADAQSRPIHAQSSQQPQSPAAVASSAPAGTTATHATPTSAQGAARIDALAGLTRSGPRTDHRPDASIFKKPSQPIFHAEKQQLTSQASRALASIISRGGGRLTLRLSPQSLGDVRVDVEVRQGTASALFRAESESARDLLKHNIDALRNALEKRGVRVERLEVVGPHSESTAPAWENDRTDGKESASSGQQQPWHGGSTDQDKRAPAEAGGGNTCEHEAEPGSATGPHVMVQRSSEGTVLRLDAIA